MKKILLLLILSLFIAVEFASATNTTLRLTRSNPLFNEGNIGTATFQVSLFADPPVVWSSMMSATEINWNIAKPGLYATDGIAFVVSTNKNAQITFQGVEDVRGSVTGKIIPTWYAIKEGEPGWYSESDVASGETEINYLTNLYGLNWKSPQELNQYKIDITPAPNNVVSKVMYLWNKINIGWDVEPNTYSDDWMITVTQSD